MRNRIVALVATVLVVVLAIAWLAPDPSGTKFVPEKTEVTRP